MWRFLKIFSIILFLFFSIGGYWVSKNILPYAIIQPYKLSLNTHPVELGMKSKELTILTYDSLELKGYHILSNKDTTRATMILLHGIGGCKEHFLSLAKKLADYGISSIVMDSRAHGQSGGQYCTYGFQEKSDISKLVDYLKSTGFDGPIGIWGHSMGGAIAIQSMEKDKRIEFGIIESTFTDLDQIVYEYQKRMTYGIGLYPFSYIALSKAGEIAGFEPDSVSPILSVQNITQPVLIAHGTNDQNIKFKYGRELFDGLKSKKKQFIPVKGADHNNIGTIGGGEYSNAIKNFIESCIAER